MLDTNLCYTPKPVASGVLLLGAAEGAAQGKKKIK